MKYHKSSSYSSLSPSSSLKEAILCLEQVGTSTVFILDDRNILLGTIADGDIRRGLLSGHSLDTNVTLVMNKSFLSLTLNHSTKDIDNLVINLGNLEIPVLHVDGSIDYVYTSKSTSSVDIPVVIMAGGRGSRLKPLTDSCPKPLLSINGTPMIELIIENLVSQGIREFYLSVNYLKHMIDYLGDGSSRGISIKYLEEDFPLGTAGSLSLLPCDFNSNFLVINADILSRIDYQSLFSYFYKNSPDALMCIRSNHVHIPFGVVQHDGHSFIGVEEKPTLT